MLFNRAAPAEEPEQPQGYAQLSDAELDDIIKRGEWPMRVQRGKTTGVTHNSGWVPRYAAELVIDKLLQRNGVKRDVIYNDSEETKKAPAGAVVIDRVRWQGRVREGKPRDLRELRREGLRELERQVMAAV